MVGEAMRHVPMGADPFDEAAHDAALRGSPWRKRWRLSSIPDALERALAGAGFDRGPWLAVALGAGIVVWFALPGPGAWIAALLSCALIPFIALSAWRGVDERAFLLRAAMVVPAVIALGITLIWVRSVMVGEPPIDRPIVATLDARVLERIEQPAQQRVRLVLATRLGAQAGAFGEPADARATRVRINVPQEKDIAAAREGARVRLRARLMPPGTPMVPGAYNFARTAWFGGLSATGSLIGEMEIVEPAQEGGGTIAGLQRTLSAHVRANLDGSPGAIAAAFASGDRGGISEADDAAMRDAGLTHLLSISGLHVSAVIAAAYLLAIRLLALIPPLALRVRLPVLAAGAGALAGIGYTLLTGAEVPTVRSCIGALLVLIALALGREALSMRMIAVAAGAVLLLWPESLIGPSFQMSFAAVTAIVALHSSGPVREFLAPRERAVAGHRLLRGTAMLIVTGLVIEFSLMPIVLYHFHRAGFYGAFANVVAIPLTTFVSMPMIALALFLDLFGLGAPAWWAAGKSLELLLGIAHWTAGQPGSVKLMPQMSDGTLALFVLGGLWLALWRGRARLMGLILVVAATILLLLTPRPDILVSGDGRHVAIAAADGGLLLLRDTQSRFARDNLTELSATAARPIALENWPGAQCSPDFCVVEIASMDELSGESAPLTLLLSRSNQIVEERALAAACERSDIVISDRFLPRSCQPAWLKVDRSLLRETGGLSINVQSRKVRTVAAREGDHGWWQGAGD
jgi:competence protein ComEC